MKEYRFELDLNRYMSSTPEAERISEYAELLRSNLNEHFEHKKDPENMTIDIMTAFDEGLDEEGYQALYQDIRLMSGIMTEERDNS